MHISDWVYKNSGKSFFSGVAKVTTGEKEYFPIAHRRKLRIAPLLK